MAAPVRAPRVVVTDIAWDDLAVEREILAPVGADLVLAPPGDEAVLAAAVTAADAIMTCWRRVPAPVLDAAPRCRIVARYGIGLDNIDVAHASALGIVVTNVPDFCLDEVADHALALILAAVRAIPRFDAEVRAGTWRPSAGQQLRRIRGQVLGLIGYGAIARTLAPKAVACGFQVVAHTPRLTDGPLGPGIEGTSRLDDLLARADVVSLHLPSTPETRHLIDAAALARMKPSACLVNTSRGAVVDEDALVAALRSGTIAGAALDVLQSEPPPPDHPLLGLPNVILTPHVAFASHESVVELRRKAAQRVLEALTGQIPAHVVDTAVLSAPTCRLRAR